MKNWQTKNSKQLFRALVKLRNVDEAAKFCRDLLTEDEIAELSNRWLVARRLDAGDSQRQIAADTSVSLATVSRVNYWLTRGMGGYRLMLDRLFHHSR